MKDLITAYGNPILEYWEQISTNQITVCKKIRRVYQKLAEDVNKTEGPWIYDSTRANRVLAFLENFCRQSKGERGGQNLKLELWLADYCQKKW